MAKEAIVIREERGIRYLHFSPAYIQGAMRIARPYHLVLEYTRAMMAALLIHPHPRSVLLIGLGSGSMAKFLYRHYPDTQITVVEINPQVVAVARNFFGLPDDPARLVIEIADGSTFVETTKQRFDLIMVDGFDHHARPGLLEGLPFYQACRTRLSVHGTMAANLFGNRRGFKTNVARIASSFDGRILQLHPCEEGNVVVFGLGVKTPRLSEAELWRRALALKAATDLDVSFAVGGLCQHP